MSGKALIIEDNDEVAEVVKVPVEELGYQLERAADGDTGLQMALESDYAFVLLDMKLPGLDGMEVCKRIRAESNEIPIIMLTTVGDSVTKVVMLELGADDYITKPFEILELKARIKAVLRRTSRSTTNAKGDNSAILKFDELEIDLEKRKVSVNGEAAELTAREFDILEILASRPGYPFTREDLIEATYGEAVLGYDQSINSHINRIRRKIEPNQEKPKFVLTVRGVGYSFAEF